MQLVRLFVLIAVAAAIPLAAKAQVLPIMPAGGSAWPPNPNLPPVTPPTIQTPKPS